MSSVRSGTTCRVRRIRPRVPNDACRGSGCHRGSFKEAGNSHTATEIRNLAREIRADSEEQALINVILPESVRRPGWRHVLGKLHVQRIKAALVGEGDVVVTNVTHHAGYEMLEPVAYAEDARGAMDGWRHVAVVLVSGVHNATARSVRYAMSLRADALLCLHIQVDEKESTEVRREWGESYAGLPLQVLESP